MIPSLRRSHGDAIGASVTSWRRKASFASLYLVVPPSDISRTKPLVRLILNQIGRRLTEDLHSKGRRHRLLLMLDEFPALGRLDFCESALAFMAGYGLKSFLIAQSLNQFEKAYGQNNSILGSAIRRDVWLRDQRRADGQARVGDALGMPRCETEMRAMKNYAGHRLSPWLGRSRKSRLASTASNGKTAFLIVPSNITLIPLPAKCPELNPQENIWQFMRDNWLSNRIFKSYDDIVDHCCHAWNKLVDQPWKIISIGRRDWAYRS